MGYSTRRKQWRVYKTSIAPAVRNSPKNVRVKYNSEKITRFYVTFAEHGEFNVIGECWKGSVCFKDGELLKEMALYFNFASKSDCLETIRTSAEVTHAVFRRTSLRSEDLIL